MDAFKKKDFEFLFRTHAEQLQHYASYILRDHNAAKDIVMDVFCTLWDRFDTMDVKDAKAYLFTSVRNHCLNSIEHLRVVDEHREYALRDIPPLDSETAAIYDERLEKISELIHDMPQRTQFVLKQCYYEEKTYKEVAQMLDISTNGVKMHIMKGLETIRKYFGVKYKKGTDQNPD